LSGRGGGKKKRSDQSVAKVGGRSEGTRRKRSDLKASNHTNGKKQNFARKENPKG